MKIRLKHTLVLIATVIFCTGAMMVRDSSLRKDGHICCKAVDINIEGEEEFVTEADVRMYLAKEFGAIKGMLLDSIPLFAIEKMLDDKSAVLKSQVWTTPDSLLHISISQRMPVARFINSETGFYVDDRGYIFPLHSSYTAPVPVIAGNIPVNAGYSFKGQARSAAEREWIGSTIKMLTQIKRSRIWKGAFPDIKVDSRGNFLVIPEKGKETFIFGDSYEVHEKLTRVKLYYSEIQPLVEDGRYRTVNVKYDGQIVCRR